MSRPYEAPEVFWSRYQTHMNSEAWRTIRRAMVWLADGRCQWCGDTGSLEVHLRDYDRLGRERPEDLIVLCVSCHRDYETWRGIRTRVHGQPKHRSKSS